MLSTLGFFLTGLGLAVALGVALDLLLTPRARALPSVHAPALGFAAMTIAGVSLGAVLPMRWGAWVLAGLVVVILGVGLALHRKAANRPNGGTSGTRRLSLSKTGAATLALGAIIGILALTPVLMLGFPTVIAALNNDSWSYAGMSAWLISHPWTGALDVPQVDDIFGGVIGAQLRGNLGVGFETVLGSISRLTGRPSYQATAAVGALAFVVSTSGWVSLAGAIRPALRPSRRLVVGLASVAPAMVTIFSENYLPHAMGIALLPLAMSMLIRWHELPSVSSLVRAALPVAAVAMVYPGVFPWVVGPWLGIAAFTVARRLRGSRRRLRDTAVSLAIVVAPAVGAAIIAPVQLANTVSFLIRNTSGAPVPYPSLGLAGDWTLAVGVSGSGAVIGQATPSWGVLAAAGIATAIIALGLLRLVVRRRGNGAVLGALTGALGVCAVAIAQFARLPDFDYGVFKVLADTGALLAGFGLLGLTLPIKGAWRAWGPASMAAIVVIWSVGSATVLGAAANGSAGFRRADVATSTRLSTLPAGSVVLVEGTSDSAEAFHQRLALSYLGPVVAKTKMIGLGTTATYFVPPGTPQWAPSEPWDYVVGSGAESMVPARKAIWSNGPYTIWQAAAVDATPYGTAWQAPEPESVRWTSGPAEIIVSNAGRDARQATLRMGALAWGHPRLLRITAGNRTLTQVPLSTGETRHVRVTFRVPANRVISIVLDAGRGTPGPVGDPRQLAVSLSGLRLTSRP